MCVCVLHAHFGGILEEGESGEREKRQAVHLLGARRAEEGI